VLQTDQFAFVTGLSRLGLSWSEFFVQLGALDGDVNLSVIDDTHLNLDPWRLCDRS
jgi:hypothetical protein